jgi:hypothetical protein
MEPPIAAVKTWTVNPVTFNGKKQGCEAGRRVFVVRYRLWLILTGAFHFKSRPSAVGCMNLMGKHCFTQPTHDRLEA